MITQSHVAWAIFNSLWQGGVIAAAAWVVLRFFRRASAAVRYYVWSAVLVASVALPAINAAMPERVVLVAPAAAPSAVHSALETRSGAVHAPVTVEHVASTSKVVPKPDPAAARVVPAPATRAALQRPIATTTRTDETASAGAARSWPIEPALRQAEGSIASFAVASGAWLQAALPFAFAAWLVIAATLFARLALGLVRLRSIKRGLVRLDDPAVDALCRSISRRAIVAASDEVGSPCVIGYARPVIALPAALVDALDASDLHRVLAHELGHVRRFDDWANLIQQCIRAALFFNPVVHIAGRALDVNREIACDDLVAAGLADRIEYAKCLTEIARRGAYVEHLMPAAGFFPDRRQIVVRIEQLLDRDHEGSPRVGVVPAASALVAVVAVAALAAHQLPAFALTAHATPAAPAAHAAPAPRGAPEARAAAASAAAPSSAAAVAPLAQNAELARSEMFADKEPRTAPLVAMHDAFARAAAAHAAPAIARLALTRAKMALKIGNAIAPRAAQLAAVAARMEAVAPTAPRGATSEEDDFLDALAAAGYSHLSVDDLIAIRNSGVSSSYLRTLKQYGILPMPAKTLIALANSGVSAATIASMASAGYTGLKADDLIALQNAGVTAPFIASVKGSLRPLPSVPDLVALADAGVTSDYIGALAKSGYAKLSATSIVKLQNAGVSSAYLVDLAKLGHAGMSVDSLIALANAGVSPEYIRALAALGYANVSTDDLVRMLDAGVTPDLIKKLRAHGFSDKLSVDELIKLAENGF